ncbi:TPA: exo-alpha-sialidase [Enterobacter ludwigii]|nr:exo-alpha-sialidase [Enterobacter ludwigii]
MPVPNQTPYIIYNANGLTTVFPFEFYIINSGDIQVTINGDVVTSGYSVSGVGNVGGGDVTFVTPPANGSVVMLERVVPTYRLTDYQDNGDLLADTVNKDFDRLWMAIQRSFIYLGLALRRPLLGGPYDAQGYRIANLDDPVNAQDAATKSYVDNVSLVRALRVPESFVPVLPPSDQRANKLLAFNAEGNPIMVLPPSGSASDVLIELAKPTGAGLIGATDENDNPSTVQDILDEHQGDIDGINNTIGDPLKTTGIVTRGKNYELVKRFQRPHRLVNKSTPNDAVLKYDHFGIMDRKANGQIYMSCRRALNHLSEGYVIFSELANDGTWSTRTIIQQPGIDMRGSSGGTAPTGDIVIALVKMQPNSTPQIFLGVEVYISRDDGVTFSKVADIPSPGVAYTYLLPFGKLEVLGNRWCIPCYSSTAGTDNKLQLLESTDNGTTWAVGATIQSAAGVDANEAAVLDCGDGVCICVARNGDGTVAMDGTHRPLVYRSSDGGVTWASIGEMRGPDWADSDSSSEINWQLVTPQLSLIHSAGGKPYILCTYTARRSGVRYRTISVDQFTQSTTSTAFWSEYTTAVNLMSPVETFESGYQSQFIQDGLLYINVFRTTTNDTVSTASQSQVITPALPDYDTGWFPVATLQNYTYNHGLSAIPSNTIIMFSDGDDGRSPVYNCSPRLYYNGTTTQGAGIEWQVNLTGYTIRTGAYLTFQGVFGSPTGPNRTSGFARLLAWK